MEVYEFNGQDWIKMGMSIIGDAESEGFGTSISLSPNGNKLAIGAPRSSENGVSSGKVKVFTWNGTNWVQYGEHIVGDSSNDKLGGSVSLSENGNRLFISAQCVLSSNPNLVTGFAQAYELNNQSWEKLGNKIEGGSICPVCISSDGETLAIGVPFNEEGYVGVYDLDEVSNLDLIPNAVFKIFPNPAQSNISILGVNYDFVKIIDSVGRVLIVEKEGLNIDISNLPDGIYIVQLHSGNKYLSSRIIKF